MNRVVAASLVLATVSTPARAETLADAVRWAMASNPSLAAARDRQDALAEMPEQARAAGRLTADADATGGYDRFGYGKGGAGSVSAGLPIWTGGRVPSAVRAAARDVDAGEQTLRDTIADVIAQVVGAYADMLFQQQAVAIAHADIALLDSQVGEARARFDLGTGTQTDVARLIAQREGAAATLASAEASLTSAAATYRGVVGRDPGTLAAAPADFARLPASLDEARRRSIVGNPAYLASLAARDAANARVGLARANGAPSVAVGGNYGYGFAFGRSPAGYPAGATAGLTVRVPILTGGLVASQVRQAWANARAASHDTERGPRGGTVHRHCLGQRRRIQTARRRRRARGCCSRAGAGWRQGRVCGRIAHDARHPDRRRKSARRPAIAGREPGGPADWPGCTAEGDRIAGAGGDLGDRDLKSDPSCSLATTA